MSDTRIHYAFVAGLFASGASFFGKFTSHVDDRKFFGSFNELLLDNPNYQVKLRKFKHSLFEINGRSQIRRY